MQASNGARPDRDARVGGEAAQQVEPPLLGAGGFLAGDIEAGRDVAVLSRPEEEHADGLALVRQLGGVVRVDAGLGEACWLDVGVSDPVRTRPCTELALRRDWNRKFLCKQWGSSILGDLTRGATAPPSRSVIGAAQGLTCDIRRYGRRSNEVFPATFR
jgi:hypothetical protein